MPWSMPLRSRARSASTQRRHDLLPEAVEFGWLRVFVISARWRLSRSRRHRRNRGLLWLDDGSHEMVVAAKNAVKAGPMFVVDPAREVGCAFDVLGVQAPGGTGKWRAHQLASIRCG